MGAAALPLIQRAIDNFVDGVTGHVEVLRGALARADAATLRSAAHRLKGSAANLGALRAAELARHLEELAEADRLEDAEAVLDDLVDALDEASTGLADYQLAAVAGRAS
jgi:HPt (histidine-containing phosphotransfer) domain-containing protein